MRQILSIFSPTTTTTTTTTVTTATTIHHRQRAKFTSIFEERMLKKKEVNRNRGKVKHILI
jgi:hypothetical protein